jgi:anthranilate synthase component 1
VKRLRGVGARPPLLQEEGSFSTAKTLSTRQEAAELVYKYNNHMQPSLEEIRRFQSQGNVIPVHKSVIADVLTPVSAFLKLEKDQPHAFLLESIEGGERIARYSFLGVKPFLITRYRNGQPANFMQNLRATMGRFKSVTLPGLPPFTGGAVGYFGYDMVRTIEDIPQRGVDDLGMDDAVLMFFKTILAFDHLRHQIHIISNVITDDSQDPLEVRYQQAVAEIEQIEALLRAPFEMPPLTRNQRNVPVRSNFEKNDYLVAVAKAKEYIAAGDIFQVVLSQRFEIDLPTPPFEIYRALRIVNPSPYMYYLKMPETTIVGASPEMLVRVRGREIEYRPIAGTLPRGATPAEDEANAAKLRTDEKERAEHIMLVDLGRNDLGRVAEYGTVQVEELMFIERYSHVMHLVSSLHGELRDGVDRWDSLMACFPAGTVSGAPKVRAMEIIDELEPTKRGVYAGAIMYADFSNNLDSCIAIRTLVVCGNKGYVQAGGGIVADSVPENEYMETVNKSRALIRAINLAQRGFES